MSGTVKCNRNSKAGVSVFICHTPFHLALSLEFLTSDPCEGGEVSVVYMGPRSLQSEGYLRKLNRYATIDEADVSNGRVIALVKLLGLLMSYDSHAVKFVYSANYKLIYTRLFLLSLRSKPRLFKFDDGMGDHLKTSWFTFPEPFALALFFKIFSPGLQYSRLKNLERRFTLYPDLAGPETKVVSLGASVSESVFSDITKLPKITVLLGQSYSNDQKLISRGKEFTAFKSVISKYKVDQFIPHPLSQLDCDELGVEVIDCHVIAEEYICNLLKNHRCHVLGFRTTAVFNLSLSLQDFISRGQLELTNLTIYKDGKPLSKAWVNDIWAERFIHVPVFT